MPMMDTGTLYSKPRAVTPMRTLRLDGTESSASPRINAWKDTHLRVFFPVRLGTANWTLQN